MTYQRVLQPRDHLFCRDVKVLAVVAKIKACHAAPDPGLFDEAILTLVPDKVDLGLVSLIVRF